MDSPEQKIKIIITDDHAIFRTGVKISLSKKTDIDIIGEAENGLALLDLLKHLEPDIIILNISMPVMDGPTTLPVLKKKYPHIKVIILTMHNDSDMICNMIELGASAYLTKECGSEEIYKAVLACYKNWFFINDTVRNAFAAIGASQKIEVNNIVFTAKEVQIIKLLYTGKPVDEIATEVDLSPRTVTAIIDKVKTKAGVKSIAGLFLFAEKEKMI